MLSSKTARQCDRGVQYFRKRSVCLTNINPFALLLAEALPTKHLDVAMGEISNECIVNAALAPLTLWALSNHHL
ncbi:hypothetical protein M405DRAFT_814808, partial [Rhizopogon salebrosus TDB-379]